MKNYIVCGTTNKTELIEGLFVKYGDGGVDIEPLSHLYKAQVYQLSEYLEIIPEIIKRTPSPDTWSFEVSDEEFYFRIPYNILYLLLFSWEYNVPTERVCEIMDLTAEQVKAMRDFNSNTVRQGI
jgi:NAD+ synthase